MPEERVLQYYALSERSDLIRELVASILLERGDEAYRLEYHELEAEDLGHDKLNEFLQGRVFELIGLERTSDLLCASTDDTGPSLEDDNIEDFLMGEVLACGKDTRDIGNFLSPNEYDVINVKDHLDRMEEGFILSCGTERSFFDLVLANPEKCRGLIVRDIDSRVKAYVDFNVLLLRISNDVRDYESLSTLDFENKPELEERVQEIKRRIHLKMKSGEISIKIGLYYLENLEKLASVYYSTSKAWRNEKFYFFQGVEYYRDEEKFRKLQAYAKAGKIIATVGDINDLQFLHRVRVSVVDTSNVFDYFLGDFQVDDQSNPLIIWTDLFHPSAKYHSFFFKTTYKRAERRI